MRRTLLPVVALVCLCLASGTSAARPGGPGIESPESFDTARRFDVNSLNMWTTNIGSLAYDLTTGNAGLEYPRGSGKTAIFAGGLWLGASVSGQARTVVAEYSMEYGPGSMSGGTFENPTLPQFQTYKVVPWTGDPADTGHVVRPGAQYQEDPLAHHGWSEYMAGAAPYGAPVRIWQLPDPANPSLTVDIPGPDVQGDQMLWSVFNDADLTRHTNGAGSSIPLGVEIQQTIHGADATGVGNAVLIRYRIINKGFQTLNDMYVGFWTDPDLGGFTDDLVGSVPGLGLVYCYNASNADLHYGSTPPAVGVLMIEGPKTALGDTLPATAALKYINGTDPLSPMESYHYLQGRNPDGTAIIDPTTGLPTTFMHPGDPIQGTGWLDTSPSDKRATLSSGTFSMAPGDTQNVVFAIVFGQGPDRLSSVGELIANATFLKTGMTTTPVHALTNCPRPESYWAEACSPSSGELSPFQLTSIASLVGAQSLLLDWPAGSESGALCDALAPDPDDIRAVAKAAFVTLLANWAAGQLGVESQDGQPIRLVETLPVNCPGVLGTTLAQLIETADGMPVLDVAYRNDNETNRTALTGVDWGGQTFSGGADFAEVFNGVGGLNPSSEPDSFVNVEIRFSHTDTQKAYRYLRLESTGGIAPAGGREYRYAGFRTVPFQVWDVDHGVQLDVAFTERCFTDAAGTIQPAVFQPASFDSTWGPLPDDPVFGDREYLMILTRPYSDTPKAEFEVDGLFFDAGLPAMYALWAKLRALSDVIDDGDRMTVDWYPVGGPSIDRQLIVLEGRSLDDQRVLDAYHQIIDCLSDINLGNTIENPCDYPTPVRLSLVNAEASRDRVTLEWYTPQALLPVTIERRADAGPWTTVGQGRADGTGMIRWVDGGVIPGNRYGYRVSFLDGGAVSHGGEVSVTVPAAFRLALSGFVPNPARDGGEIEFVLATRAPATLQVFDLQGRRVVSREVGHLGPGRATVSLRDVGPLRAGIYVLTLTQGAASVTRKSVVVR